MGGIKKTTDHQGFALKMQQLGTLVIFLGLSYPYHCTSLGGKDTSGVFPYHHSGILDVKFWV
jgi:hypothetical protein